MSLPISDLLLREVKAVTEKVNRLSLLAAVFSPLVVLLAFLALYIRTAAPSVLSGDSAEFQMAATLLGVPHPTTYPLYVLLGKLFTLIIPVYDLARRVTLVSSVAGAIAVMLMFLLARRVTRSTPAAVISALAVGVAPELWNAATIAEVYTLLAALLAGLWLVLLANDQRSTPDEQQSSPPPQAPARDVLPLASRSLSVLAFAAFLAGLGFSHHGLFTFTAMPLFGVAFLMDCVQTWRTTPKGKWRAGIRRALVACVSFGLGVTPWLYPLIQYARFGPYSGDNYGLPHHYFWGSPTSWGAALDLLTGGGMRRGVFRLPTLPDVIAMMDLVRRALRFNFGPQGLLLGVIGLVAVFRIHPVAWASSVWIFCGTFVYLVMLGPAVQDAPMFTIPMLLPWALWIGIGSLWLSRLVLKVQHHKVIAQQSVKAFARFIPPVILIALIAMTLVWGYTRVKYSSKRHLWLFRDFGQATLQQLPPNSVVMTHWEQGMLLQYLVLVERQRPDVWVDVVEPGDAPWGPRAAQRYSDRPVYFIGSEADVAGLPVELVLDDSYADIFVLKR